MGVRDCDSAAAIRVTITLLSYIVWYMSSLQGSSCHHPSPTIRAAALTHTLRHWMDGSIQSREDSTNQSCVHDAISTPRRTDGSRAVFAPEPNRTEPNRTAQFRFVLYQRPLWWLVGTRISSTPHDTALLDLLEFWIHGRESAVPHDTTVSTSQPIANIVGLFWGVHRLDRSVTLFRMV